MRGTLAYLLAGAFLFNWTFNSPDTVRAAEVKVLQAAGCKTEYFLLQDLAKAYMDKTGTKLQLGSTGNKKALNLLMEKKIDFAFTCKTIDQLAKKLNLDPAVVGSWKSIPVAIDPIVVVANRENGAQNLTKDQLTSLFQGKIANWKELGGNDLPVKIAYMNPALESGVNLLFNEFTVGEGGTLAENAQLGDGPSNIGNYVSLTPGGVMFIGFNSYDEKYGDILSIDGVAPTRENILNGSYPLAASYYLTLAGDENTDVSEFINFVRSDEGIKAIEINFIPSVQ